MNAEALAAALNAKRSGDSWIAPCPSHDDKTPSLAISEGDEKVLVHCHAGCDQSAVIAALADRGLDIREQREATHASVAGFAEKKRLDVAFLKSHGVRDLALDGGRAAVGFDYRDTAGVLIGTKVRTGANGKDRAFFWQKGSRPCLYGAWRIEQMHMLDQRVVIVEGESDCLTLWKHEYNALGLPGANSWREQWADDLHQDAEVYVVVEPDAGGEAVLAWLAKSKLRDRARLVRMPAATKDPSALYLSDPEHFAERFDQLLVSAEPWRDDNPNAEQPRIALRWFAESTLNTAPAIVAGLLGDTALALVYGASGSGKSTFMLELELAIARAILWRGQKTKRGLVIHVCGEGTHGVTQRLIAYAQKYMGGKLEPIPFAIVPGSISLMDAGAIVELIETLRELGKEHGGVRLITFDTLARCLSPGDENDSGDMGLAITACDRIRHELNCAVCLIHHSGKDTTKGARGHSSLRAAVDTEVLIEEVNGLRWATVCKQRDLATAGPFGFDLEAVEIGVDEDGQPITACVVVHQLDAVVAVPKPELRGKAQRQLLAALRAHQTDPDTTWTMGTMREVGRKAGMHKNTARAAVEALVFSPFMVATVGGYRLAND